jgi:hypothetical protein
MSLFRLPNVINYHKQWQIATVYFLTLLPINEDKLIRCKKNQAFAICTLVVIVSGDDPQNAERAHLGWFLPPFPKLIVSHMLGGWTQGE